MNKKYVVYEHVTPDGMYYFGQSQNVEKRWSNNGAGYKGTALQPYIEKFGWENIKHIILFENQTKEDALFIEDFLIETAQEDGVCINKKRSGNISKEEGYKQDYDKHYYKKNKNKKNQYHEQNRDKISDYQRDYREKNKDKISDYQRDYREKNKDKKKQYYEQNKDKIKELSKQYKEKNREKIREYNRQYYQRKKLEKQLKEVETTPLF